MKPGNDFMIDMLDFDLPAAQADVLWRACKPTAARAETGAVVFTVPFQAQKHGMQVEAYPTIARRDYELWGHARSHDRAPRAARARLPSRGGSHLLAH